MYAASFLEKNNCELKKLFNQYPSLHHTGLKALVFKQSANDISKPLKLTHSIGHPEAHRNGLEPPLREIVGEHLSVKRVLADLLDMIGEADGFAPKMSALLEPGQHPVKEVERDISARQQVPSPLKQGAAIGESI